MILINDTLFYSRKDNIKCIHNYHFGSIRNFATSANFSVLYFLRIAWSLKPGLVTDCKVLHISLKQAINAYLSPLWFSAPYRSDLTFRMESESIIEAKTMVFMQYCFDNPVKRES